MRQIGLLTTGPGSADKSETASIDLTWAVTGATWLVVVLLVCGIAGDPDFWGHLRFGLDIFASAPAHGRRSLLIHPGRPVGQS